MSYAKQGRFCQVQTSCWSLVDQAPAGNAATRPYVTCRCVHRSCARHLRASLRVAFPQRLLNLANFWWSPGSRSSEAVHTLVAYATPLRWCLEACPHAQSFHPTIQRSLKFSWLSLRAGLLVLSGLDRNQALLILGMLSLGHSSG